MARISKIAPNRHAPHPFDIQFGTDTAGYLSPKELQSGAPSDAMNNGYSAVAPSVFREACRRWRETLPCTAARLEAYTFVDVGAGKGRTLLLAAEFPFRRVIGVELNPELSRAAQRNIAKWTRATRSRRKIRVVQDDAMQFRWPRARLLVYLNNPFSCDLVEKLSSKLAALAASGPSLVDLLYVNPDCAETLSRAGAGSTWSPPKQGRFELLWNAQIEMDEPDRQADPYGAASDRVACFRIRAGGVLRPTARATVA